MPQNCIAETGGEADPEDVGLLVFRTPLAAFDALLVLRPEALPQVSAERGLPACVNDMCLMLDVCLPPLLHICYHDVHLYHACVWCHALT